MTIRKTTPSEGIGTLLTEISEWVKALSPYLWTMPDDGSGAAQRDNLAKHIKEWKK